MDPARPPSFEITWESGPSAQLEILSPLYEPRVDCYRLKYTPPFRKTLRQGMLSLDLDPSSLDWLRGELDKLVNMLDARRPGTDDEAPQDDLMSRAREAAGTLYDLVVPSGIRPELLLPGLFLELGIDEPLVEFPWELMFDGEEFLCLRHRTGRFVNTTRPPIPPQKPEQPLDRKPTQLNVLLIAVPRPDAQKGKTYRPLPGVDQEIRAITQALQPLGQRVSVSILPNATYAVLRSTLKTARYHIVHFSGHAEFDSADSRKSVLVLQDRGLTPAEIQAYFGTNAPVFFFMNACETARLTPDARWKDRYDIFGIARGCLETGAYLVGNRWPVGDAAAAAFAGAFYSTLGRSGTLGEAVLNGRLACRKNSKEGDLSWASYVFYGDPRLCFKCDSVAPAPP